MSPNDPATRDSAGGVHPPAESSPLLQDALHAALQAIGGELELQPLLSRIVREACELAGASCSLLFLSGKDGGLTAAAHGLPLHESRMASVPASGLLGQVVRDGLPILLARSDGLDLPLRETPSSSPLLVVPLLPHDKAIGCLCVGGPAGGGFDAEEIETLGLFARHAALGIENARLYEASRLSLEEMRHLYQTSRRISAALTEEEVVEAYLEQVPRASPWVCSVALYEWGEDGRRCAISVRGRWTPGEGISLCSERYPYHLDALDQELDAGRTVTIRDIGEDPRASDYLRETQVQSGRPSLAMVPLIVRGTRVGLVALSYSSPREWREEELRPFEATATLLASALDNRQQRFLLSERTRQLATMEERSRITRELHDSVSQLIFSITLIAQSLGGAWKRDPAEGESRVNRLVELSRTALAEMRGLLANWRAEAAPVSGAPTTPGLLQVRRDGLAVALRQYLEGMDFGGLRIYLDSRGYERQAREHEEALFRIAQEALHNAAKHASASEARVLLSGDATHAILTVTDDGVGFEPSSRQQYPSEAWSGGLGLSTMRERAETLGGSLEVQSRLGGGTAVVARLPRKERTPREQDPGTHRG